MPELTEQERADLWVSQRVHEAQVKQTILRKMTSDPQAIEELVTDWTPLIVHLAERQERPRRKL